MVLESVIKPFKAVSKPWEMFFFGILAASFALFLGYWIFREESDVISVFFTVFACIPLMFHAIRNEEKKDTIIGDETTLLREHSRMIAFFVFLFMGMTVAYSIWYLVLPPEMTTHIFEQQLTTIGQINAPTGHASSATYFLRVVTNNVKVLGFCLLFAFFYGAGAIFILAWNASVMAVAIGTLAKGLSLSNHIILSSGFAFSRYFIHGIPEMIGYMIGGLAGGIISAAVINHDFKTRKFQNIIMDASTLLLIAFLVLIVAAIIEAFITPAVFSSAYI